MQAIAETLVILALFNLRGGEIVLVLLLVLILFGSRKLPELGRGLRRGIFEFREATKQVTDEIDEAASEAGRSVGGVYGKAAAQALTPDNQVAELYSPGRPEDETQLRKRCKAVIKGFMKLWWCLRRFVRAILDASDR